MSNYDVIQLETYLNDTYFYKSSHPSLSLRKIYFSIDTHSLKTTFDISGVPPIETVNIKFVNKEDIVSMNVFPTIKKMAEMFDPENH